MPFAFNPDDGPARCLRFYPEDMFEDDTVVAVLDQKNNVLIINQGLYEKLQPLDQHRLQRTHEHVTRIKLPRIGDYVELAPKNAPIWPPARQPATE